MWIAIGAAAAALLYMFLWLNNHLLSKTRLTAASGRVCAAFRIVQLSDVHSMVFGRENHRLIDAVSKEKPSLIAITGDLVARYAKDPAPMYALVQKLCGIAPVFYVNGNHEYGRRDREAVFCGIAAAGARVLRNATAHIRINGNEITVLGIDDMGYYNEALAAAQRLAAEPGFRLLLAHHPQRCADRYAACRSELMLCGHAHGGQFILPFIGGLFAPGQGVFPRYYRGIYDLGTSRLVVSRGMGNSGFPFRLFNPPDIVVIDVVPG